jgi:hypothetical protein
VELLGNLPERLTKGSVGEQVCELVRVHHTLRDLGSSIGASLAPDDSASGRARLIAYLLLQVGRVVHTDELMIVAGIGDYPRRIRELRTQLGWPIISGLTVMDLRADGLAAGIHPPDLPTPMVPEEYLLIEADRDKLAPARWTLGTKLRSGTESIKAKIGNYFRANMNQRITSEELRYVSGNNSEWTVATRAFRETENWNIRSRCFGDGDMPPGIYVLGGD